MLLLYSRDKSQSLCIAFKAAEVEHSSVENSLTEVAERRVAEIMRQACELDDIRFNTELHSVLHQVAIELDGNRFGDLRDLQRMGQAIAKEVGFIAGEELRLALQAPKGR